MKTRNIVMLSVLGVLFISVGILLVVAIVTHEEPTLMGACWPNDTSQCGTDDPDQYCNMDVDRYEVDGTVDCPPLTWPEGQHFPLSVGLFEPDTAEADPDALLAAIDAINNQLGFDALQLDPDWEPLDPICYDHHAICVQMNVAHEAGWMEHNGTATHAWTQVGFDCQVMTSNTGTSDLTHDVLRHELLHCLGLAHDEGDDSIMAATQRRTSDLRDYRRIRDADRAELRRRYNH